MFRLSCVKRVKLSESGGKMQNLVRLTLIAACLCAATGTPLPAPSPVARRADRSDQSEAYAASEDHLFNDEGFPLRASARIGDAGSNPDSESRGFAGHRGQYKGYRRPASPVPAELRAGDQPPFNDPFSGFFFDMQDMMKILRDQMSVVLSRVPPKSMNGDDGPLSFVPSDVRNQTTTKVDNKQQADSLLKAESRWENEIDNRIDSYQPYTDYQPYYNTYRPTGNYYEPQRTRQPIYNHQPGFNAHGPRYFTSRPVYNTNSPNYKSYQQDFNSYRPNFNSFDSNNNQFVDLSGDTKVNDFMAAQQQAGLIMADPDAEIIDIHKRPVPKFQYPQYNYRNY
ncbi:unnamed protein product [Bemisia tabaci]|uniref:Uncharacterized protein n=1 Tax=Bemisia tabaci TaxID=7038 RepID=A0A9P0F5Y1_BEMTA|nr:unnamed protein product [Bemisia tabaci]